MRHRQALILKKQKILRSNVFCFANFGINHFVIFDIIASQFRYILQAKCKKMYIHIGDNRVVRKKDIVGIFDMDSSTVSVITRKFLSNAQKNGRVIALGYDLPRSFIVMRDKTIYLSSLIFNGEKI